MPKKAKNRVQSQYFTWSLFQRNGVFYADGRGSSHNLGKHSLNTRDREEAERRLRELDQRMAVERGLIERNEAMSPHEPLPIDEGWARFEARCTRSAVAGGVTASSWKRYQAVKDHHAAFCGELGVSTWQQVDRRHALRFVDWLADQGQSSATQYLSGNLISQIVKWLIDDEKRLPDTQRFKLSLRRSEESPTYCFSRNEVAAMIARCSQTPELTWLAPLLTLLAATGMRISEARDLRWTDIDFDQSQIKLRDNRHSALAAKAGAIRTTKGGRGRTIPIHPQLRPTLQAMPRSADGRVFHGPRGGRLKPDVARRTLIAEVVNPLGDRFPTPPGEIGFLHGRFHRFRHFFVSQAFLGGASEGEIREWVGHSDSRVVERYRHQSRDDETRKMSGLHLLDAGENLETR